MSLAPVPGLLLRDFAQKESHAIKTESSNTLLKETDFFGREYRVSVSLRECSKTVEILTVNNEEEAGSFLRATS